jgi:hypothetical protein
VHSQSFGRQVALQVQPVPTHAWWQDVLHAVQEKAAGCGAGPWRGRKVGAGGVASARKARGAEAVTAVRRSPAIGCAGAAARADDRARAIRAARVQESGARFMARLLRREVLH